MKIKNILSISVFIAGVCSIIYELLISATASYFLGDGVKQFSILIGIYLFSMGLGAYFSKFLKDKPLDFFVIIEFILGLLGGVSVPMLYFLYVNVNSTAFQFSCLIIMFFIGLLTGMEVPLLTFADKDDENRDDTLSNVLSLDYIGGLIATLVFPFILLPFVGLFYSSLLFGSINLLLGIWLYAILKNKNKKVLFFGIGALILLAVLGFYTDRLIGYWENRIYKSPIIYNHQTPYQRIVVTKNKDDIRLFLNRAIQFSSKDEARYHEMLVHVPMLMHENPRNVLILGGGENLASREVLKHPSVLSVDVVDIDSMMLHISKTNRHLLKINEGAALDKRVKLIAEDAFSFLKNSFKTYDVIIADLPDPANDALARLYSKQFFMLAKRNLNPDGIFVTQSGEIFYSNNSFNCIKNTLAEVYKNTTIYQTNVPSFGSWGFTIGTDRVLSLDPKRQLPESLKFLSLTEFQNSFKFPLDIPIVKTKINTLDNPVLLTYFLDEYEAFKNNMFDE